MKIGIVGSVGAVLFAAWMTAACGAADEDTSTEVVTTDEEAACLDACQVFSTANITGHCCSCNGQPGVYERLPRPRNTYRCVLQ